LLGTRKRPVSSSFVWELLLLLQLPAKMRAWVVSSNAFFYPSSSSLHVHLFSTNDSTGPLIASLPGKIVTCLWSDVSRPRNKRYKRGSSW
jgi:hypothetical protein